MNALTPALADVLVAVNWLVLGYALTLNTIQVGQLIIASVRIPRILARDVASSYDDLFAHPATPGVSVVVPAFNEAAGILEATRSLLTQQYPEFEVIIVDDGSTDTSFEILRTEFSLIVTDRRPIGEIPTVGEVLEVYEQADGGPLIVVRKRNAGRRSDAVNVGINMASMDLVCMVDGDSILEPQALLTTVKPFLERPDEVVGVGGVVRPANGIRVASGQVVGISVARSRLARVQIVEYLRSFLLARVAWTGINGVLIVSGAFGLFRRETILELGGLDPDSLGEDAELVATLHHRLRRAGRRYQVVIVPQPVCWSEVPETLASLGRQRRRWSTGLAQVLWNHAGAMLNPRYGRFGLIVLPYYLLFELLAPVVEVVGLVVVPVSFALGIVNLPFALTLLLASIGFGTLLSLAAIIADEIAFHRYERLSDVAALGRAAVLENAGIRQVIAVRRLQGLVDAVLRKDQGWGAQQRRGFSS